ncbi:HMA2 domain-containing protein [Thiocapsa sp. UBA6158]|uniref:HMA2 domain-containing protein n=1 Tax=Thiocapsa sp. UBA6158 TaxID=1947692 RepID=UPI0039C9598B
MKVCHQTNGRLRLRISALHRDRGVADRLESALRGQAGILAVRANPACASLMVRYEVGPALRRTRFKPIWPVRA